MPVEIPLVTPAEARAEALRLVVAAAERSAGSPGRGDWFVIPAHDGPAPVVVVPAAQRRALLEHLREAPRTCALRDPGRPGLARAPAPAWASWSTLLRNAGTQPAGRSSRGRAPTGARTHLADDAGVEMEFWDRLPSTARWSRPAPTGDAQRLPRGAATATVEVAGVTVPTLPLMARRRCTT